MGLSEGVQNECGKLTLHLSLYLPFSCPLPPFLPCVFSALLVLLQDSLTTTAGSPMFSELVMKVTTFPGFSHLLNEMVYCLVLCFSHSSFLHLFLPLYL